MKLFFPLFKSFFGCEKSIALGRLNQKPTLVILHFQILNKKNNKKERKKNDAAHFLDARGNEKQVSNLE